MEKRRIKVRGFDVDVCTFESGSQFFYPAFNGNAEYKVSKRGYKQLLHYLGVVIWCQR